VKNLLKGFLFCKENPLFATIQEKTMKNKYLVPVLIAIVIVAVFSFIPSTQSCIACSKDNHVNDKGIKFSDPNWSVALKEARSQNKLIFLDAYASWCGPCKLLKKNTFTNEEAGAFFNKNFINVAFDMEKGDGLALADKFAVTAYPTLIIADASGNIITYTQGYINPKQLIEFGKAGLSKQFK
jgi:thiol:disulfide interchange protein